MTTAATTTFCAEKVEGPGGHLWVDGNQKITAGNGTYAEPKPNAFSLVQVVDCPYRTPTCEASCYVHGLEKHAPETHALYVHNSKMIRDILDPKKILDPSTIDQWGRWAKIFGDWISKNCQGGFRWHVSGDLFSYSYAAWVADVCDYSPDVNHWIYTRSFPFIEPLLDTPNLTVNLSCDMNNYWWAKRVADEHGLRLCYLTRTGGFPDDLPPGSVVFPDYALRGRDLDKPTDSPWWKSLWPSQRKMVCPVDFFGKSEKRRCGPCKKCLK